METALLIQRVQQTQHGFSDIRKAADEVVQAHELAASTDLAHALFVSNVHQARMLATFIFGHLAVTSDDALRFLRLHVSQDKDWRVQEILAQAFDTYCATAGYEQALQVIDDWLGDPAANVRRAVTEGLRVWTTRPFFRRHPEQAVQRLCQLKADESVYVRTSVGNALRDISRKHTDLIREELQTWDCTDKRVEQVHKLASKFLKQ